MEEVISLLDSNKMITGEDTVKQATTVDSPYGVMFNEQYVVAKILGKGRYGTVFEARNVSDRSWYAVKEVKVEAKIIEFIEKEAERHQKLDHKHVVKYVHCFRDTIRYMPYDDNEPTELNRSSQTATRSSLTSLRHMEESDTDCSNPHNESGVRSTSAKPTQVDDATSIGDSGVERLPPSSGMVPALYIVMELCDMSLRQYLLANRQQSDRRVVWTVVRQILKALKHLKKNNIGHGDLHEGNILLKLKQPDTGTRDLSAYDIKLCDLGLLTFGPGTLSENTYPVQDQQNSKNYDLFQVGHIALLLLVHPRSDSEADEILKRYRRRAEFPAVVQLSEQRIIMKMTSVSADLIDVRGHVDKLASPKTRPTNRATTKLSICK